MRSFEIARASFCSWVAVMATPLASLGLEPPRELIEGLEAEAYPERIAAEDSLRSWAESEGEPAKNWLLRQHLSSENPEVRRGLLAALRSVVIEDLAGQRPGFVGIEMKAVKLPEDLGFKGYGIEIQTVNPGTPAEKAGLRVTDVILKLDGQGWTEPSPQHEFAGRIGKMRGGDQVRFEILRGKKTEVVELALAPRPWTAGIYNEKRQLRGDPFAGRSRLPQNEAHAENDVFQEWMKQRRAEISER